MENPLFNLTYDERREYSSLSRALTSYIVALEEDRNTKIADPESGHPRKKRPEEEDNRLRPTEAAFFRMNDLWWKAFGTIADASQPYR